MRYLKIYIELIKQSTIRAMAYKVNFIIVLVSNLAYFLIQLLFMKVIFTEVDSIAGWSKYEMFFYIGTFSIIDGLWVFGPYFNLLEIPSLIREGGLDSYLLKPVNSQFLVTLRKVDIGSIISMFSGVAIVIYAAVKGHIKVAPMNIGLYILLIFLALLVEYSVYLLLLCLAFWMVKVDFADVVHGIVCYFSNKPSDIYSGVIKKIITFFLPYGLVMTIASKAAISKVTGREFIYGICISLIFFIISSLVWKLSLKHYSSASS